jgi:prepilin-type N-terminal cleavage/methylation domain-containing protein
MKRLRRNDAGFTLIELLVVIAATSGVSWMIQAVM